MDKVIHDRYWIDVSNSATNRIRNLFSNSGMNMNRIIGKDVIENYEDAKKALTYILLHGDTCEEKACGILSLCEIVQNRSLTVELQTSRV